LAKITCIQRKGLDVTLALYAGATRLGTLTQVRFDYPRAFFDFERAPEFEEFRKRFDLRGSTQASHKAMEAAEKLDLRVIGDDDKCIRLLFISIHGKRAVIQQEFFRQ